MEGDSGRRVAGVHSRRWLRAARQTTEGGGAGVQARIRRESSSEPFGRSVLTCQPDDLRLKLPPRTHILFHLRSLHTCM